jgi:hypothetical protein
MFPVSRRQIRATRVGETGSCYPDYFSSLPGLDLLRSGVDCRVSERRLRTRLTAAAES